MTSTGKLTMKPTLRLIWILLIALVVALSLTACMSETEEFFQGVWMWESEHLKTVIGESYQKVTWKFDNGWFDYHSCCYPEEVYMQGSYRVIEETDNMITLELYDIVGASSQFGDRGELRI